MAAIEINSVLNILGIALFLTGAIFLNVESAMSGWFQKKSNTEITNYNLIKVAYLIGLMVIGIGIKIFTL